MKKLQSLRQWMFKHAEVWNLLAASYLLFILFAFIVDSPKAILEGLVRIYTSRTIFGADYIAIGGLGATLVNVALTGGLSLLMLYRIDAKINGSLIMALFLVTGFSFYGKTMINMLPVMGGVWLYSKFQQEPFINFSLVALLATTLSPVASTLFFSGLVDKPAMAAAIGVLAGLLVGFFIPVLASSVNKVHAGYDLYNMGFAGGIISLFFIAVADSFNIKIDKLTAVGAGNNLVISIMLFFIFAIWISAGLIRLPLKKNIDNYQRILDHSGRLVTDYFLLYRETAFINMGLLGIMGTLTVLLLGAELNGATLAGIFTMMGFAAFGKHISNCFPVMSGAIIFAYINHLPPNEPANIVPILFCTGLAPIAGQYGWLWGLAAGVLHLIIVGRIGTLGGGLNLYNNGFAAGFVVIFLLPIILIFSRKKGD